MIIDGLSWHQFSNLPHIASLPLNRQLIEYEIYNQNLIHEVMMIQQQQQMLYPNVPPAAGTGAKPEPIIEDEGLPSGCIEFTANTFDSRYFDVIVGTSTETAYTVNWGDGNTSEGTLFAEDTAPISHEYENDSQEYIIRLCFANASAVTSLEIEGND